MNFQIEIEISQVETTITKVHKGYEITLLKENSKANWYIIVQSDKGIHADGYWKNSEDKNEDDAYQYALSRSGIKTILSSKNKK